MSKLTSNTNYPKMKKPLLLMATAMSMMMTAPSAGALDYKIVDNYFEGFDNVQTGSNQSAIGWGRIFDYTPLGAIDYRLEALGGMEDERSVNTNVLSVQWQETWDDETGAVYSTQDMIVTPRVEGNIQFFLSKKGSQASSIPKIKAYKCTRNADFSYTLGEQIDLGNVSVASKSWTQVDFNLSEPTYVALWMEHCYFDSFSADKAEIPQLRAVQLNGFGAEDGQYSVKADREGNVEFKLSIRVTNRGNLPLNTTDEDFSFEVKISQNVVSTIPVDVDLLPGEATVVNFSLPYKLANPTKSETLSVTCVENVSRTISSTSITLSAQAYVPVLEISSDGKAVSSMNFGFYHDSSSVDLTLSNKGAAPLEISAITLPEGVTLDLEAPLTIEGGASRSGMLTIGGDSPVSGKVGIESNTYGDIDGFNIIGAKVAPGTFTEEFADNVIPARWIMPKAGAWTAQSDGSLRSATSSSSAGKIILPAIDIASGSRLLFALTRTTRATYYECYVKVFASDDRSNWTEIGKISSKDTDTQMPDYDIFSFVELDVPAGKKYLAFEGVYVKIDNIAVGQLADVSHDIYMHSLSADATGMVNYPVAASLTLQNVGPKAIASGEYSLELTLDGKCVALVEGDDAKALDNAGGKTSKFDFSFIPHAASAGSVVSAQVKVGDKVYEAEPAAITIAEEEMSTDVLVGTRNTDDEMSNIPLRAGDKNSYSEFIYTASQLGLQKGDKIASVSFYYFINAERNPLKTIKMWVENTDKTAPVMPESGKAFADTVQMTRVACKDYTFARTTDRVFDKYSLLTIPFDESFEYDGGSLRFIVGHESSDFVAATFLVFRGGSTLWSADDVLATVKRDKPTQANFLPTALIKLDKTAPVVSGTVTDGISPLAGAEVVLASDGVEYYGTSGSDGRFGITVKQASRSYEAVVAAHAFVDTEIESNVYATDTDLDEISMKSNAPLAETISFDAAANSVEWQPVVPGSLDTGVTYDVELDGKEVATGLAEPSYSFADPLSGAHTVGVYAVFAPAGARSDVAELKIGQSGISEVVNSSLRISACEGGVEVTCDGDCSVEVFDTNGRLVTAANSAGFISLPSGLYIVRAKSDTTLAVKVAVK